MRPAVLAAAWAAAPLCEAAAPACSCTAAYPYCWDSGSGYDNYCYKSEYSDDKSDTACPGDCTASFIPAPTPEPTGTLQQQLQAVLDAAAGPDSPSAITLGWKSADLEFSLASGTVNATGVPRPTTTDDTFLYGSGSKPFTAAAVMKLVERGAVSLNDSLASHIDPVLQQMGGKNVTMAGLFGANGTACTVGMVLRMSTGIRDYDRSELDDRLLYNESNTKVKPLEYIQYVASQPQPFMCTPGSCVSYSSTNYVIAGLILAAHGPSGPAITWDAVKQGAYYPDDVVAADLPGSHFFTDESLSPYLTVPGTISGEWYCPSPCVESHKGYKYTCTGPTCDGKGPDGDGYERLPDTLIFGNKSSSILGYTCSNVVAPTLDVARWFWDLVGPAPRVVSAQSLATMVDFRPMTIGWEAGSGQYGAGLMLQSFKRSRTPATWGADGASVGHLGEVYGFGSYNAFHFGINASISVASNSGWHGTANPTAVSCQAVKLAFRVLLKQTVDGLEC